MKNFIITTTDTIEGATIEKYIELVSANIVIGANIFSDFAASFTDFFGGYSNTYQNKLDKIYDTARKSLQQKATDLGANAIVGTKFDFGEISGKGNSMFMVSAIGMAICVRYAHNSNSDSMPQIKPGEISYDYLNREILRRHIIDRINKGDLLSENEWEYLLNNPIDEILEPLLIRYLKVQEPATNAQILLSRYFPKYVGLVSREVAIKELYNNINEITLDLLHKHQLFDPTSISRLIAKGQRNNAVACLSIPKSHYTHDDLEQMEKISERIKNLPDTGHWETSKSMFGKEQKAFICEKGHKSFDISCGYCRNCGRNIKGLTEEEDKIVNDFNRTIDILKELIY